MSNMKLEKNKTKQNKKTGKKPLNIIPIVYMSGFMKTRPKDRYRALSGRFFLARNSKGDDIKIKRKSVLFSFFYPFVFLSLPSCLRVWRNQGEIKVIGVEPFTTVFINPDMYIFSIIFFLRTSTVHLCIFRGRHCWLIMSLRG